MIRHVVLFFSVLTTGVIAGIIFGIWIGYNPRDLSAMAYVEQQQNAIRALNVLMPVLGLIAIVLTVTAAFLQRSDRPTFVVLLIAAVLLLISGVITRFGNQPLNAIVITWDLSAIPADWKEFRDKWWSFHIMRTISALLAFSLIVWSAIRKYKFESTSR